MLFAWIQASLTYTSTFTFFFEKNWNIPPCSVLAAKSVVLVKPVSGVQIVILTSITHFSYCSSYNPPPFTMSVSCPVGSAGPFLINPPFHFGCWKIISISFPIGSMYGIYANIGGILMVNVTIYSIHGSYGFCFAWLKPPLQKTMLTQNLHFECAVSTYSQAQKNRKSNKCQHFNSDL